MEKKILFGGYKPLEFTFINQLFGYLYVIPFQCPSTRPKGSILKEYQGRWKDSLREAQNKKTSRKIWTETELKGGFMIEHARVSVYTVQAGTCRMHIRRHLGFENGSCSQTKEYCLQLWHVMKHRAIQP